MKKIILVIKNQTFLTAYCTLRKVCHIILNVLIPPPNMMHVGCKTPTCLNEIADRMEVDYDKTSQSIISEFEGIKFILGFDLKLTKVSLIPCDQESINTDRSLI